MHEARVEVGRKLALEAPVDADMVIGVPESGTPAAIGYAQGFGIPYGQGFVKNSYVGRTFIQPSQTIRQLGIRLKLNPLREAISGKRLVVVDDSIVRGNTQRAQVRMLRESGAAEVHVRISSPPVAWPCFYGIDFASKAELVANGLTPEQICGSSAPTRSPTSRSRRWSSPPGSRWTPVPGLLRRHLPDPAAAAGEQVLGRSRCSDRSTPGTRRRHARGPDGRCRGGRRAAPAVTGPARPVADLRRRGRRRGRRRPRGRTDEGLGGAATRPEVVGGLGGFAGLFDASALKGTAGRCSRPPPTASAPRWRSPGRWSGSTRSAATWSACSSTTSWSAAPSRCS